MLFSDLHVCTEVRSLKVRESIIMFSQTVTVLSLSFSHFPYFAHRFLALPCKIMLYLLFMGMDHSPIVSAIKKGLTTGEK